MATSQVPPILAERKSSVVSKIHGDLLCLPSDRTNLRLGFVFKVDDAVAIVDLDFQ